MSMPSFFPSAAMKESSTSLLRNSTVMSRCHVKRAKRIVPLMPSDVSPSCTGYSRVSLRIAIPVAENVGFSVAAMSSPP